MGGGNTVESSLDPPLTYGWRVGAGHECWTVTRASVHVARLLTVCTFAVKQANSHAKSAGSENDHLLLPVWHF